MARPQFTLKADEEIVKALKEIQSEFSDGHECAVAFLESYRKMNGDATDDSPLAVEARRVDQLLGSAKNVMLAFMTLAEDKAQAELEDMTGRLTRALAEASTLKATLTGKDTALDEACLEISRQSKEIADLRNTHENVQSLKELWANERQGLKDQIVALDAEAQGTRALQGEVATLKGQLQERAQDVLDYQSQLAVLSGQRDHIAATADSLKKTIDEMKASAAETVVELRKTQARYAEAMDDVNKATKLAADAAVAARDKDQERFFQIKDLEAQVKELKQAKPKQPKKP